MKRILVVGEPMVELLEDPPGVPRSGFGGDALNVAVYLAREVPEHRVALATAVGDDPSSDGLIQLCLDERIDVSWVARVAGARIGAYRVVVDEAGERAFSYDRSASPFRGWLDDGGGLPDPGGLDGLIVSGIAMAVLHDEGRRALARFVTAAQRRGALVVFDPNHRSALWENADDAAVWIGRIVSNVDIVLASAEDGRLLLGLNEPRAIAAAIHELGAPEVSVTDGANPGVVLDARGLHDVPAVAVRDVIDTTAAGDAFDAGYVAARLRGIDPLAAAAAGQAIAAHVIQFRGAIVPPNVIG